MTIIQKLINTNDLSDTRFGEILTNCTKLHGWDVYIQNIDKIASICNNSCLTFADKSLIKLLEIRNKSILSNIQSKIVHILQNRNIDISNFECYVDQVKTILGEDVDIADLDKKQSLMATKIFLTADLISNIINDLNIQQKTL